MTRLSLLITASIVVLTSTSALASRQYQPNQAASSSSLLIAEDTATSSQFVSVEHPTQGQVRVVEEDGARYIAIGEDFQSDRGPALQVILHKANTVDLQVQEGDYISLGALQSFNGAQRYLVPEDVDLDQYQSVAVWCEQFNATFGYAPLAQ